MVLMGAGLLDLSTAGVHTSYPPLAVAVAIMGAGMGLVMAPASTTIMTTVPAHQAGAGSAINDTIREVGGALGHRDRRQPGRRRVPLEARQHAGRGARAAAVSHVATGSVAAANTVGRQLGGVSGAQLTSAAHTAYITAMATGMRVSAAVAIAAAAGRVRAAGPQAAGGRSPPPAAGRGAPPGQRGGRGVSRGAGGITSGAVSMIMT